MGFFRDVGRKVERAKRAATGGDGSYRCQACDAQFDTDHDFCPDCGAAEVTATSDEE